LAAPVGSLVCGSQSFIDRARRARKVLGGGMRQAGVLAAVGIVALTEMTQRLAEDHANARKLAEGIDHIDGLFIDPAVIRTNLVFFHLTREDMTVEDLVQPLEREGIRILSIGPKKFRAVTHYHITSEDIDYALEAFNKVMQ
jgi:threonine aldolase